MSNHKVYLRAFFDLLENNSRCLLCRQPSRQTLALCQGCQQDLPYLGNHCIQCAEPLPDGLIGSRPSPFNNERPLRCGRCLKKPPAFSRTLAPLLYLYPIDILIHRYKQHAEVSLTELLSRLFIIHLQQTLLRQQQPGNATPTLPQQLIAVPLHRNRLYQRGFNQSAELTDALSRRLQIPVNRKACRRILDTPHQQGLSAKQRRHNLRHAFEVDATRLKQGGGITHIALIDDVMTTGSTAQILAQQLRRAGAEQVDVWCIARTPPGRAGSNATTKTPPLT
ncbi:MAG: ComF family protein [Motiliproteus sp.]